MTIKSMNELLAQADATIEDNTTGNITPSDVRSLIKDLIDTISPAYGAIGITTPVVFPLTATPAVLKPFDASLANVPSHYTNNLANGSVTRLVTSAGLAGATDFVIIDGNVEGPNGDLVTIALYKNGSPTPYTTSVMTTGASEPIGFNLAALSYTAADAVYEIRVSGDAGNKTFSKTSLICQSQPVRSFV